jgi:hypothetical protein
VPIIGFDTMSRLRVIMVATISNREQPPAEIAATEAAA